METKDGRLPGWATPTEIWAFIGISNSWEDEYGNIHPAPVPEPEHLRKTRHLSWNAPDKESLHEFLEGVPDADRYHVAVVPVYDQGNKF